MYSLKRSLMAACAIGMAFMLLLSGRPAAAQVMTTGSMGGVVRDAQGAVVPGVTISVTHAPSGTVYEAVTRGDGRFFIDGMRVGGPYTATASLAGFNTEAQSDLTVSLGTTTDVTFTLTISKVTETVTVVGKSDIVFSSSRTGAATAVLREETRESADDLRAHQRHDAPVAPVHRRRVVRRRGQPHEQHHG